MSTANLIDALAADPAPDAPPSRALLWSTLAGLAIAAVAFFILLGPRPDFMPAMQSWRFVFKFVVTLLLAASTALLVARAARPDCVRGPMDRLLYVAPVVLLAAVVVELFAMPSATWMPRLMGHNALVCMACIPVLALGPLALLLFALRSGATLSPMRAGALAGLMAGGLGAAFYAAHCPDDSPLFVAVWYSVAIAFVTAVGAVAGRRVLRW
jgi:hypothetical protein